MSAGGETKEKRKKRMRMTLPKKESDLEKVVQEVMELHPELAHEHHHHHGIDEYLHVIDTLIDILNTRVRNLEEKCDHVINEVRTLYRLVASLFKLVATEVREEKEAILRDVLKILESS